MKAIHPISKPATSLNCQLTLRIFAIIFLSLLINLTGYSDTDSSLLNHVGYTNARVLITSNDKLSIEEILDSTQNIKFLTIPEGQALSHNKIYWYKIDMNGSDLSVTDQWIIRFPNYDHITMYFHTENGFDFRTNIRTEINSGRKFHQSSDIPFAPSELIDGRYLYAKIKHIVRPRTLKDAFYATLFAVEFDRNYFSRKNLIKQIPYFIFIGGMSFMIFYFFGIYFMYKDKLFILYSFYLLSLLLYLGIRAPIIYFQLEGHFPYSNYIFNELIQVIVNAFYLQFASVFLKAQTDFPKLYTAIRIVVRLLVGIMVIQLALLLSRRYAFLEFYLINFERFFVIFFTLGAYYYIIKHYKERIILFLLGGSFFFLTGAIFDWIFNDVLYMMMGSAIEVFVFSLGMGYRVKMVAKEKESIENEIVKIQLTALKAQMNPHFIFNSLNSIRAYVISNNVKMASDYLTKFSRLIRLILNYSSKNTIALKDELDALTLYVQLEQLRFRDDFGFVFNIHACVDSINWHIPPLILQPYVENAIIHGLAPKKGDKKLQIDISCSDSQVVFKISDNGVGRNFSKKKKRSVNEEYKSMAMELTKKRIDLTELTHSGNENIIINDLTDGINSVGTEVILKLPVLYPSEPK